jgi:hypothetical protein
MFKLASLFVDIRANDQALQSQLGGVHKQLAALGVGIGSAAGNLAASVITSAASAITGFFSRGIAGASNLGESMSKVQAVFGESAGVLTGIADELAAKFGLPKQAILDAGAAIGLVGKAAGQSQGQAADMGAKMAKLAADASSFYNVPLDEALGKIRSGLVGESEPLRAFGVLLSEEAVAAEAVALGLAKSSKEVDQQAKVMARASLIAKGLADATGDLERTQNSTANQWRKFQGTIENLAVSIGEALAPAVNELISLANEMGQSLVSSVEGVKSGFASFVEYITAGVKTVGVIFRNWSDIWQIVFLEAQQPIANVVAVVIAMGENISNIAGYIGRNWYKLLTDAFNATATAFSNLIENFRSNLGEFLADPLGFKFNWTPLLTGFEATAEKLPELVAPAWVSMEGEINAIGDRMAARESDRAAKLFDAKQAMDKAGSKTAQIAAKKEKKFKSETIDVADFTMTLRASIFGGDDTAKQQLETQKKIEQNTKKISDRDYNRLVAMLG